MRFYSDQYGAEQHVQDTVECVENMVILHLAESPITRDFIHYFRRQTEASPPCYRLMQNVKTRAVAIDEPVRPPVSLPWERRRGNQALSVQQAEETHRPRYYFGPLQQLTYECYGTVQVLEQFNNLDTDYMNTRHN
jgi:hypothetical protein